MGLGPIYARDSVSGNTRKVVRNSCSRFVASLCNPTGSLYVLTALAWMVTGPYVTTAVLRKLLTEEPICSTCEKYPFFTVAFYSAPMFLISVVLLFRESFRVMGDKDVDQLLSGMEFFILGCFSALFHLLRIASLQFTYMSAGKFIMVSQLDWIFAATFSTSILGRQRLNAGQIAAFFGALGGITIYYILDWDTTGKEPTYVDQNSDDLEPVAYAIAAAFFYALRALFLRRMLVKRIWERKRLVFDEESQALVDQHVFFGHSEPFLAKLDDLFDSRFYDSEAVGDTLQRTFKLEGIGAGLLVMPFAILVSYFHGETTDCYQAFADAEALPIAYMCYLAIGLPYFVFSNFHFLTQTRTKKYAAWKCISIFLGVIGSSAWMNETLGITQVFGLGLLLVSYMFFLISVEKERSDHYVTLILRALVARFADLENVDVKGLIRVYKLLGLAKFQDVVQEMLITGNLSAWQSLAPIDIEITARLDRLGHAANASSPVPTPTLMVRRPSKTRVLPDGEDWVDYESDRQRTLRSAPAGDVLRPATSASVGSVGFDFRSQSALSSRNEHHVLPQGTRSRFNAASVSPLENGGYTMSPRGGSAAVRSPPAQQKPSATPQRHSGQRQPSFPTRSPPRGGYIEDEEEEGIGEDFSASRR